MTDPITILTASAILTIFVDFICVNRVLLNLESAIAVFRSLGNAIAV